MYEEGEQISLFGPDTWCGKTSPEPCHATRERTSASSSKRRPESSSRTPIYLDLRGGHSWPPCGAVVGDGWSLAWRVLDAQFWGVPQRRRRIALVADFGGQSAPEILFIRKSVSRDFTPGGTPGERIAAGAEGGAGAAITVRERGGCARGGVRDL